MVTDDALHMLDLNEVVPEPDAGLSLQLARLANHQTRRRRPSRLVIASVFIGLMVAVEILCMAHTDITQVLEAAPFPEKDPGVTTAVAALVVTMSGGLTLITAAPGVAAWRGHPHDRITLMTTLILGIAIDMVQVPNLGVRQTTLGLVVTSTLQVLALLVLSARQVCQ